MFETYLIQNSEDLIELVNKYNLEITERDIYQHPTPCIGILFTDSNNKLCLKYVNPELICKYNDLFYESWR